MIAVVMVNECAGLSPSDWMYWVLSCWAMPFMAPVVAALVAFTAAWGVQRYRSSGVRFRLFRACGFSVLASVAMVLR